MVSAPTPRRFLISRWMASLEARIGLRFKPVRVLSASKPLRGEQAAGGHFHRAVQALERKQFLLQEDAGGKEGKKLTVRFNVVQRGVIHPVFIGQPAENVLLALHRRL